MILLNNFININVNLYNYILIIIFRKEEICIIGDQLLTDVFSGKNYNIMTILVDPLGKKDLKVTKINRIIENIILKKYNKKGIFKRGNYYE